MKLKVFALSFLALQACADLNTSGYPSYPNGGYGNQYPQYPNNGYPSYPNNGYPVGGGYPNGGYPSGGYYPPPQPPPTYDCRYYGNCPGNNNQPPRRPDWDRDHDHHLNNNNANNPPIPPPVVIPPPPSTGAGITPSCPSGTVFDGQHCKITDSRLKRPGGDGNINPCPNGSWMSNGKCVKR